MRFLFYMKTILVTGGSRGIGLATIKRLLTQGHKVINISRNSPALEQDLTEEQRFIQINCDLGQLDKNVLESHLTNNHPIDVIFNNAGTLINKPFLNLTDEELEQVYRINVFSIFKLIQICFMYLAQDAHIVNVSSIGGISGTQKFPGLSVYSSSKGAVTVLTECLQAEFQHTSLAFNGLAFGAVQTEMLESAFPGYRAPVDANEISEFIAWFLLNGQKFFKGKILPVSLSNP